MRTTKMLSLVSYFLISLSAISQTTDFSEEENQYVKSVLIEIDSTEEITYKETIERLEDELRKLPRHPDLVFPYLRMNDVTGRSETASNYCQEQLGNNYLKKNQDILKKCIECAITNGDLEYAKPIIELVDDLTAQDLIKASIALENNIEEFKTLGMKGINNDYVTLNRMKYNVLNHLIAIYYAENNLGKIDLILDKYLDMYLEKPEKLSTGFDALVILYLRASENEDFKKGLKIMKMAEVIYEEDKLLLT